MAAIDVAAARADTPACERVIHFNNAGASLMPEPVYRAVRGHLDLEREVGGYEAERAAQAEVQAFYDEFAALLGARADEIAYVENATRAWDMAFYGLPLAEGDRILTHASEYVSNWLGLVQQARRRGLHLDLVPSDGTGQIDVAALERMIGPRTRGDRADACADAGRAGEPGGGGRADRAGARADLPARRLPVGGADRRSTWAGSAATCCRGPGGSSCAGRAGPGFCMSRGISWSGSSRRSSTCGRRPGPGRRPTSWRRGRGGSRTGRAMSRGGSGWRRRCAMPAGSGSRRSRRG